MRISFVCILFILLNAFSCRDRAGSQKDTFPQPKIAFSPRHYVCYRTNQQLTIDGKLTEQIWDKAVWTADFVDIEGNIKPLPQFHTRVKMLWDDQNFYVAAELQEPHVWAKLTHRDTIIYHDNDFEVFIDPDDDTHLYYEFEINAFGTEWDLFLAKPYRDGGPYLTSWDIQGLQTGVFINGTINNPADQDEGWTVEMAFPWQVLKECATKRMSPKSGEQWRVNFSRVEWKTEVKNGRYVKVINSETGKAFPEDNWVWSPQGIINMHYPEMWGFVQFSDKVAGAESDSFIFKSEENAKWALRQVYYQQKAFYKRHGKYTDNFADLGLQNIKLEGYNWPPTIEGAKNQFEANLTSLTGTECWVIVQDGHIWRR